MTERSQPEPEQPPTSVPAGSSDQVGAAAADVRPDLAADPQDEAERTSDGREELRSRSEPDAPAEL